MAKKKMDSMPANYGTCSREVLENSSESLKSRNVSSMNHYLKI